MPDKRAEHARFSLKIGRKEKSTSSLWSLKDKESLSHGSQTRFSPRTPHTSSPPRSDSPTPPQNEKKPKIGANILVLSQDNNDHIPLHLETPSRLTIWELKTLIFKHFSFATWAAPPSLALYMTSSQEFDKISGTEDSFFASRTGSMDSPPSTSRGTIRIPMLSKAEKMDDSQVMDLRKEPHFFCEALSDAFLPPSPGSTLVSGSMKKGTLRRKRAKNSSIKKTAPSAFSPISSELTFAIGSGLVNAVQNYQSSFKIFAVSEEKQMLYTTSYVASCLSSSQEEGQGEQDQETDSPRPLGIPNDQITIDIVGVRVMKGALIAKEVQLPYTVKPIPGASGIEVLFCPKESGAYLVSIKVGHNQLPDSPYRLTVAREEDVNAETLLKTGQYLELARMVVRLCLHPSQHHHFFSKIGVKSLIPLLQKAESEKFVLYSLNALLANEENRDRVAFDGGAEFILALGNSSLAWKTSEYYYLLLFLCNALEGAATKGEANLEFLKKFAPIERLSSLLTIDYHPLCRLAVARSVLALSQQSQFCKYLSKSPHQATFIEEVAKLVVKLSREGEDLGPWDPDVTSARVNGLLVLSNLIDIDVIKPSNITVVIRVLQKLSTLLMHSQMRKAAVRFATSCVAMCLNRKDLSTLLISKHIRASYTSLLAILKSCMYNMSIAHETKMVQIFTQFDFGCDNLSGASVNSGTVGGIDGLASLGSNWNALLQAQEGSFGLKTTKQDKNLFKSLNASRREKEIGEEHWDLLNLVSKILTKEMNDLLPVTSETTSTQFPPPLVSATSLLSFPSSRVSSTASLRTLSNSNQEKFSSSISRSSRTSNESLIFAKEEHSAQSLDSLTQLLARKAHAPSLLAISRLIQGTHSHTRLKACQIFKKLSSYPELRDEVAIYGFYPMSQILGASGKASEVDHVVVEALNNFLDGTNEMEIGPWEIREDPELYTSISNGKTLKRDQVSRMVVTASTVQKLLNMISTNVPSDEKENKSNAQRQAIMMLGRLLQSESSRAVIIEKGKGVVQQILRFGIEQELTYHTKIDPEEIKLGTTLPKERAQKKLKLDPCDLADKSLKKKQCFVAKWQGRRVTVKTLSTSIVKSAESFLLETSLLCLLDHPRVVQVLGVSWGKEKFSAVSRLYSRGSLLNILYNPSFILEDQFIIQMAEDICNGLDYLHDLGMAHLSIKPQNLLLDDAWRVSIADAGANRMLSFSSGKEYGDSKGVFSCWNKSSMRYTAPEIYINGWGAGETGSDLWSFGLVLYELIVREKPFKGVKESEMKKAVVSGWSLQPSEMKKVSLEFYKVILKCTDKNVFARGTCKELLLFFSGKRKNWGKSHGPVDKGTLKKKKYLKEFESTPQKHDSSPSLANPPAFTSVFSAPVTATNPPSPTRSTSPSPSFPPKPSPSQSPPAPAPRSPSPPRSTSPNPLIPTVSPSPSPSPRNPKIIFAKKKEVSPEVSAKPQGFLGPTYLKDSNELTRHENDNLKVFGWGGLSANDDPDQKGLQEMLQIRDRKMSMRKQQTEVVEILPDSVPQTESAFETWSDDESSDGDWSSDDAFEDETATKTPHLFTVSPSNLSSFSLTASSCIPSTPFSSEGTEKREKSNKIGIGGKREQRESIEECCLEEKEVRGGEDEGLSPDKKVMDENKGPESSDEEWSDDDEFIRSKTISLHSDLRIIEEVEGVEEPPSSPEIFFRRKRSSLVVQQPLPSIQNQHTPKHD